MKTSYYSLLFFSATLIASCSKTGINSSTQSSSADNSSTSVTRTSLVAWYTFNGDVLDHSGNNNNIDFNNATPTAGKNGEDNTAYSFDGSSNYMTVPNSASLNPRKITIAALFKPTGVYSGEGQTSRILMKGIDDQSSGDYFLGYYSNGTAYGTYGNGQFASNGVSSTDSAIRPNRWYTLVYTYDGNVGKLYINGNLVNQLDKKASFSPNSDLLRIGNTGRFDYPYWFKGLIDEIKIYNTALNNDQVTNVTRELGK